MKEYLVRDNRLYLFPTPSFWTGLASLIDVGGGLNMANYASTDAQADSDAIRSDWLAVGDDIAAAILQVHESMAQRDS